MDFRILCNVFFGHVWTAQILLTGLDDTCPVILWFWLHWVRVVVVLSVKLFGWWLKSKLYNC